MRTRGKNGGQELRLAEAEARLRRAGLQVDVPADLSSARELEKARLDLQLAELEVESAKLQIEAARQAGAPNTRLGGTRSVR